MKKFLPLIAIAAMSLSFGALSVAQDAGPRGGQLQGKQGRGGNMKRMGKLREEILSQLHLTADQKKKLAALDKKTGEEMKALMESGNRDANRAKMRQVMDAHRDGMKAILTKEQNKKFRELMMAKMKEIRERRQGAGAPPPPAF